MGVKSYIAGLKADAISSLTGSAIQGTSLYAAKVKTDVTRETVRIESDLNNWYEELKADRDFEKYPDKLEEKFNTMMADIDNNENLGSMAKSRLKTSILPKYKENAKGNVKTLSFNAQLTEIEVATEAHGDLLISSKGTLPQVKSGYKSYLENLDIYNEGTINKMVNEFEYVAAPQKALQSFQSDYAKNYLDPNYSVADFVDKATGVNNEENGSVAKLDQAQHDALLEKALAYKTSYDAQVDTKMDELFSTINGEVDSAKYEGKTMGADAYDEAFKQVPERFKSKTIMVKNAINENNDSVITKELDTVIASGSTLSNEDWNVVDAIYDPTTRDTAIESLLANEGRAFLQGGGNITQLQNHINSSGNGKASFANQKKAYAAALKEWGTDEANRSKVAEYLISSGGGTGTYPSTVLSKSGLEYKGNIDLTNRPVIENEDGSVSTLKSMSFEEDGQEVLIPTIVDGKQVDNETAIAHYKETGKHLGKFETLEEATTYAKELSTYMGTLAETFDFDEDVYNLVNKDLKTNTAGYSEEVPGSEGVIKVDVDSEIPSTVTRMTTDDEGNPTTYEMPSLKGKSSSELTEIFVKMASDGQSDLITQEDLALIHDKSTRDAVSDYIGNKDNFIINAPLTVSKLSAARLDSSVSKKMLKDMATAAFDAELITQEKAEEMSVHSPLVDLENWTTIDGLISTYAKDAYKNDPGEQIILKDQMIAAVERAVAINPDLAQGDFSKLMEMVKTAGSSKVSSKFMENLENINKVFKKSNISSIKNAMIDQDLNSFMYNAGKGDYDLFLEYGKLNTIDMKMFRAKDNDMTQSRKLTMNAVTKELTNYKSFEELQDLGTEWQQTKVLANANYLLTAGVYEKALEGSYGFKAADIQLIGTNWAYQDPENEEIWFYPLTSEVINDDKLNWGMYRIENGEVIGDVEIRKAVDPKAIYDAKDADTKISNAEAKLETLNKNKTPVESKPYWDRVQNKVVTPEIEPKPYPTTSEEAQSAKLQAIIKKVNEAKVLAESQIDLTIINRAAILGITK